ESVTLTNGLVADSSIGVFSVAALSGNNTVDASNVTNNVPVLMLAGTGNDTFHGGSGPDGFEFTAANFNASDIGDGGGGSDALYLISGGTIAASAFTNVTNFEALVLFGSADANITLNNASVATSSVGNFFVVGNNSNNVIDASNVTTTGIAFQAGS